MNPLESFSGYTSSASLPFSHFKMVFGHAPHARLESLQCLLARVWSDGRFELLNRAWETLGYSEAELTGRCFCELIALESDATCAAMTELLDEHGGSVEFELIRKDGRRVKFHWQRRMDDFSRSVFVIGQALHDAIPEPAMPPRGTEHQDCALPFQRR
jgi:PAS domain S-box-containing protein